MLKSFFIRKLIINIVLILKLYQIKLNKMKNEILNAITNLGIDISKVENYHELYEEINYNGTIHEIVDGHIDIYYYDLRKWAVDNWEYVEEANEQGIGTNGIDYHKDIQAGQYLKFEKDAVEIIEEIFNEQEILED